MPSPFDRALAVAERVVVRTFGEAMTLLPERKSGRTGGSAGADTTRPGIAFRGALSREPLTVQRSGDGGQNAGNLQVASGKWLLWLDAPLAARLERRAGDHVRRECPPQGEPAEFRISSAALPTDGGVIHYVEPV
ncbi:hypothetical protein [Methylobacterium gnaphalii]|uniref:Uncharacterized protein n=1 Tax=Methylobacterium gnaphalii TaxID=1010610 RepID=A0A512JPD1_9HYPH|nr:hypothetical protein [Methylobacterium gnaphalii]GEP11815.1 hypothetical protein MGN01_36600 [Methylobacterium gnaphalii]GJD70867.1 hypothetical protein MMMDOFMJ_3820 [Methylobacterium gnaphalii]GLS49550.1 hypothetical protein GCM10007885_23990 [Methylobacterium gnaphalii]